MKSPDRLSAGQQPGAFLSSFAGRLERAGTCRTVIRTEESHHEEWTSGVC
jgi:hypothetical protein